MFTCCVTCSGHKPVHFLTCLRNFGGGYVVIGSSPILAYCAIFIVMSSGVVDLHICICISTSHCLYLCTHTLRAAAALPWPAALPPTQFSGSVDLFSPVCYRMTKRHVTAAVFKLEARYLDTFQVRRCWKKIDSAVNLGETPSSEFVHCVLWVIRLTKTVESICCAVRHTLTLPRAVWRTIRSPHPVRVLIGTKTDAGRHRPSAARPTTPAVCSVGVFYYAVTTTRLLLSACC